MEKSLFLRLLGELHDIHSGKSKVLKQKMEHYALVYENKQYSYLTRPKKKKSVVRLVLNKKRNFRYLYIGKRKINGKNYKGVTIYHRGGACKKLFRLLDYSHYV